MVCVVGRICQNPVFTTILAEIATKVVYAVQAAPPSFQSANLRIPLFIENCWIGCRILYTYFVQFLFDFDQFISIQLMPPTTYGKRKNMLFSRLSRQHSCNVFIESRSVDDAVCLLPNIMFTSHCCEWRAINQFKGKQWNCMSEKTLNCKIVNKW